MRCNLQSQQKRQRDRDFKNGFVWKGTKSHGSLRKTARLNTWEKTQRRESAWGIAPIVIPFGAYCRHRVWVTDWKDSEGEREGVQLVLDVADTFILLAMSNSWTNSNDSTEPVRKTEQEVHELFTSQQLTDLLNQEQVCKGAFTLALLMHTRVRLTPEFGSFGWYECCFPNST